MKTSIVIAIVSALLFPLVCSGQQNASNGDQVLIVMRDRKTPAAGGKQYMATNEALLMKKTLEDAGFKAVVATPSDLVFIGYGTTLKPDLNLTDVKVTEYSGIMLPSGDRFDPIPRDAVAIVKQAAVLGKPIAAQRWGIDILAEADALNGRRYAALAIRKEPQSAKPENGNGIVYDDNIITSNNCPKTNSKRSIELTNALIAELRK